MTALIIFWVMAAAGIFITIKYKKPLFLLSPFAAMAVYMVIAMAMVPLPFWETVQFVFSLK
ncbi:hypothetical protein [Alteribacillus sp. HJP-4]|uniref:hypothetical protein n=1 Tax=Alteribacillus sp. HJP-4 TaxID=2775394 RepID=UPI0035CD3B89